jgi:hypothetical protein
VDAALIFLNIVLALAAVASAVFAFVQAKSATDSRRDAEEARNESRRARDESAKLAGEANTAFIRQAEAQEEANRLKKAELTPPTWSGPRPLSGNLYAMVNMSPRVIQIERFAVDPSDAAGLVHLESAASGIYPPGSSFDFAVLGVAGSRPRTLAVHYRFEGDEERHEFIIPL